MRIIDDDRPLLALLNAGRLLVLDGVDFLADDLRLWVVHGLGEGRDLVSGANCRTDVGCSRSDSESRSGCYIESLG